MIKSTYLQGRSFPPSAHGIGIFILFISCFLVYVLKGHYWILSFCYLTLWIVFSSTTLDVSDIERGIIKKRVGFFPLKFNKNLMLSEYAAGLIRQVNVKYITTQSNGRFVMSSQENTESYMALLLKRKGKYEFDTLFKGTEHDILLFIQNHLKNSGLKFYRSAIKTEFEIQLD